MTSAEKLNQAIDYLAQGNWQRAHAIAQETESKTGGWIHGIVHVLEADLDNARYWYRRAGREFPKKFSIATELADLRASLTG